MKNLTIPVRENVSENNKALFDNLEKSIGFVPNMFATFAHSPTALGDYLTLQNRKTSLSNKEKEIINLIVSQLNGCDYCKSAHTAVGQKVGFTEDQTLEIRKANITFNDKYNALVQFTKAVVEHKGYVSEKEKSTFFNAGYTMENLVDTIILIGDKIMTNYLFAIIKVPIDFPMAKSI
ncbi:MAG: carboxymuconolactone decarboxylase family protein [Flavobacteriaceae bacterium]